MKKALIAILPVLMMVLPSCGRRTSCTDNDVSSRRDSIPAMGFWREDFDADTTEVRSGETFSTLMNRLGLGASRSYLLAEAVKDSFDVRRVRAGNRIFAYYTPDTLRALKYVVYEQDKIRSTVFACGDSLRAWTYSKPVTIVRKKADVTIRTSLWNDMIADGNSPELILELADIYAWTVDFFGLREGDRFRALYDLRVCEGEPIDISKVDFAIFNRGDYSLPTVRFDQGDGGNKYWNEKGESMRKAFLKAPLKFNRISSGFSYHRRHPVTGKVKAHTGVDYAAPMGTPVHALGDGTVLSAGWGGGGGNTVKIRHNSVYTTAYLHLRGFAKGIKAGVRVHQGDVIGYVGSTGTSTGPHLDFRVWKNGTPINPLKMESPSAEPARKENLAAIDSLYRAYLVEIEK